MFLSHAIISTLTFVGVMSNVNAKSLSRVSSDVEPEKRLLKKVKDGKGAVDKKTPGICYDTGFLELLDFDINPELGLLGSSVQNAADLNSDFSLARGVTPIGPVRIKKDESLKIEASMTSILLEFSEGVEASELVGSAIAAYPLLYRCNGTTITDECRSPSNLLLSAQPLPFMIMDAILTAEVNTGLTVMELGLDIETHTGKFIFPAKVRSILSNYFGHIHVIIVNQLCSFLYFLFTKDLGDDVYWLDFAYVVASGFLQEDGGETRRLNNKFVRSSVGPNTVEISVVKSLVSECAYEWVVDGDFANLV